VDRELEVIHDQMEETRASLANKLEALESQVRETVQSASETVASAVEGAKEVVSSVSEGTKQVVDKVSETVESVKEKLSVRRYVEQYPWASLGVAVAAGFVAAQLLPRRPISQWMGESPVGAGDYYAGPTEPARAEPARTEPARTEPARHEEDGWSKGLEGVWKTAATTVEGLAVGTLMSVVKNLVAKNLPHEWQGDLNRVVDDITTRLGGKVMEGNPLSELLSGGSHQPDNQQSPPPAPQGPVI
jgi:ElaB/YqjD/DUF883 family membrane-anchored ribosome-binding protein